MASTALITQDDAAAATAPMVEPPLTGMQPISVKKTLMLVNAFVVGTADFLNQFTSLCEAKLARVSQQLQRTEIVLALLEAKLDSIGWMAGGTAGGAPPASAAAPAQASGVPDAPGAPGAVPAAPAAAAPAAPAAPSAPLLMVKDDARFSKYFKMLNMGVPKAAVKMKMGAEGLDPDVLDLDPEAPAPAGGGSSQALVPLDGGGGGGDDDGNESEKSDNMSDDD